MEAGSGRCHGCRVVRSQAYKCVMAEIRKLHDDPAIKAAINRIVDTDLFLNAITVGEIAAAIRLLRPGTKKRVLAT